MAVSHQWFVQWSAPPMLFADITSQYNDVNDRWKSDEPTWSDPAVVPELSDDSYKDPDSLIETNHKYKTDRSKKKGKFTMISCIIMCYIMCGISFLVMLC